MSSGFFAGTGRIPPEFRLSGSEGLNCFCLCDTHRIPCSAASLLLIEGNEGSCCCVSCMCQSRGRASLHATDFCNCVCLRQKVRGEKYCAGQGNSGSGGHQRDVEPTSEKAERRDRKEYRDYREHPDAPSQRCPFFPLGKMCKQRTRTDSWALFLYPPKQALKESRKVARWRQPFQPHRGSSPPETVQGSRRVRIAFSVKQLRVLPSRKTIPLWPERADRLLCGRIALGGRGL
jgi:hypothetical protein